MRGKIEEQIQKAIEEGKFDHLAGKGKPLNLEENPFEDPEWRLANKMLREAGFSLPWIEMNKEIDADLKAARAALKMAWDYRTYGIDQKNVPDHLEEEWQRAVNNFREKLERINKRIFNYNLITPSGRFQRLAIQIDQELKNCQSG